MFSASRRTFLGASLAGLAAAKLLAVDKPPAPVSDDFAFRPATLFLTWQSDPTTTMTIQWVGTRGETADTNVYYTPFLLSGWRRQPTKHAPYPLHGYKVLCAQSNGIRARTSYYVHTHTRS